jgi:hypothetical protein
MTGDFVKRVIYLAAVRNLAMLPLTSTSKKAPVPGSPDAVFTSTHTQEYQPVSRKPSEFDKVLFLNDIYFSPQEAIHLMFDTNKGDYTAACALDYDNPVKFYDTYAFRDTEGYSIGLPLFPFFTRGDSRKGMMSGTDAVPVRSCWGGMVSFKAAAFTRKVDPVRFRGETELDWDASECCLIHADIDEPESTYVNPFIRVSYTPFTFKWLWVSRRTDKIFVFPHALISWVVGMPWFNPRQFEKEGDVMKGVDYEGKPVERIAGKGGYCGRRALQIIEETPDGRRKWRFGTLPPA